MSARLTVTVPGPRGTAERFVFEQDIVSIGRARGNDLVLEHSSLSRHHARILLRDHKLILVDLGSTNGTFVNGQRLGRDPIVLQPHDQVTAGSVDLIIEEEDDAPTQKWFPAPPLDPVEEGLLASIDAGDHASRVVYADWLEEHGDPARAEFLRVQDALVGLPADDPAFLVHKSRLDALGVELDRFWRMAVSRSVIEGCLAVQLECPKDWGSLAPTQRPDVRRCGACERSVYYCETVVEARQHVEAGACVALDLVVIRWRGDLTPGEPRGGIVRG